MTVGTTLGDRMSQEHLHAAMLEAAMDAVIAVDSEGRIMQWNASAETMFGRAAEAVVGLELAEVIVPESLRAAHRYGFARYAAAGVGTIEGGRTETTGERADGSQFPVELTISRIVDDGQPVFVGFLRDITERQRMVEDLRDSRARLIAVSDDTRRRVERDLHDGAQQQLVALAIALGIAQQQVAEDPASAGPTLEMSSRILAEAIDELRELARGVHSGILTERGLTAAVTHLAKRSPIEVSVSAAPVPRLATVVETSVYYLMAEALTNATKYGARRVWIDLHIEDSPGTGPVLIGRINDDGPGGADPAKGTGLAGMTERMQALGGSVHIDSPRGDGTSVRIEIPIEIDAELRASLVAATLCA